MLFHIYYRKYKLVAYKKSEGQENIYFVLVNIESKNCWRTKCLNKSKFQIIYCEICLFNPDAQHNQVRWFSKLIYERTVLVFTKFGLIWFESRYAASLII